MIIVNEIIEKKKKLIDLLREKRASIIAKAVTNGLDPKAPLIDSGIPWLGKIPKGWGVRRVKYVLDLISGHGFPEELQGRIFGDFPFYKVSDINGDRLYLDSANNFVDKKDVKNNNWKIIPSGSILTAKIGAALSMNHRKITTVDSIIDNNMLGFILKSKKYNLLYLYYLSTIIDMGWFVNPGAVPSVNMQQFKNEFIPELPITDQKKIVDFLGLKIQQIDDALIKIERSIELVNEYRTSLISSAVTGKIQL